MRLFPELLRSLPLQPTFLVTSQGLEAASTSLFACLAGTFTATSSNYYLT